MTFGPYQYSCSFTTILLREEEANLKVFCVFKVVFGTILLICSTVKTSKFDFVQILWWQLTISAKYKETT